MSWAISKQLSCENSATWGQCYVVNVLHYFDIFPPVKLFQLNQGENEKNFSVQIANDNSKGQIVLSGKIEGLNKLILVLKENSIKNIMLPVSAPFHCRLMSKATNIMREELNKLNFITNL